MKKFILLFLIILTCLQISKSQEVSVVMLQMEMKFRKV